MRFVFVELLAAATTQQGSVVVVANERRNTWFGHPAAARLLLKGKGGRKKVRGVGGETAFEGVFWLLLAGCGVVHGLLPGFIVLPFVWCRWGCLWLVV
jgi:hypothetical protein